jgi:hypothetical protein
MGPLLNNENEEGERGEGRARESKTGSQYKVQSWPNLAPRAGKHSELSRPLSSAGEKRVEPGDEGRHVRRPFTQIAKFSAKPKTTNFKETFTIDRRRA